MYMYFCYSEDASTTSSQSSNAGSEQQKEKVSIVCLQQTVLGVVHSVHYTCQGWRAKGALCPPQLGLNDKLAPSQQLQSTVS